MNGIQNNEMTEVRLDQELGKRFLKWLKPETLSEDERNLKIVQLIEPLRSKHHTEVSARQKALYYGWAVTAVSNALKGKKKHYYGRDNVWSYRVQLEYLLFMLRHERYAKYSVWKVFSIWSRAIGRINVLHQMEKLGMPVIHKHDTKQVRDMAAALGRGNDASLGYATLTAVQQRQYDAFHLASMPTVPFDHELHAQDDDDDHPFFD